MSDNGGDSGGGGGGSQLQLHLLRGSPSCNKPVWLVSSIADLDQKIRRLVLNCQSNETVTFAQRAEFYYQQRPQLVSLLQDLYETYLSLANRYCQSRENRYTRSPTSSSYEINCYMSDAESSLSYQLPTPQVAPRFDEVIVSEFVFKSVEIDLMGHELELNERRTHESCRKIGLQMSLLEVLESERLILLNENASLRCKVGLLIDENKGLASESMFMKRKAGELARCVMKMRDDYRVCMTNRKIEDLQGRIYGLEKKNEEYYQELTKREKSECSSCKGVGSSFSEVGEVEVEGVNVEACFQGRKGRGSNKKSVKFSKWWEKFKSSDVLFICKPH